MLLKFDQFVLFLIISWLTEEMSSCLTFVKDNEQLT